MTQQAKVLTMMCLSSVGYSLLIKEENMIKVRALLDLQHLRCVHIRACLMPCHMPVSFLSEVAPTRCVWLFRDLVLTHCTCPGGHAPCHHLRPAGVWVRRHAGLPACAGKGDPAEWCAPPVRVTLQRLHVCLGGIRAWL